MPTTAVRMPQTGTDKSIRLEQIDTPAKEAGTMRAIQIACCSNPALVDFRELYFRVQGCGPNAARLMAADVFQGDQVLQMLKEAVEQVTPDPKAPVQGTIWTIWLASVRPTPWCGNATTGSHTESKDVFDNARGALGSNSSHRPRNNNGTTSLPLCLYMTHSVRAWTAMLGDNLIQGKKIQLFLDPVYTPRGTHLGLQNMQMIRIQATKVRA